MTNRDEPLDENEVTLMTGTNPNRSQERYEHITAPRTPWHANPHAVIVRQLRRLMPGDSLRVNNVTVQRESGRGTSWFVCAPTKRRFGSPEEVANLLCAEREDGAA